MTTPYRNAASALRAGYAYVYRGKNWRTANSENWDTEVVGEEVGKTRYVGSRLIDDVGHNVFQAEDGTFYAQTTAYTRNADLVKRHYLSRVVSLTYGVVPKYPEFEKHAATWEDEDGNRIDKQDGCVYWMELVSQDAKCGKEAAQGIPGVHIQKATHYAHKLGIRIDDVPALWAFLNSLVHHANDAAEEGDEKATDAYMSLASGIMTTLGYEWV